MLDVFIIEPFYRGWKVQYGAGCEWNVECNNGMEDIEREKGFPKVHTFVWTLLHEHGWKKSYADDKVDMLV